MKKTMKILHPYIMKKQDGNTYVIKNTRIRVIDIAIEYEYLGLSPDEILEAHLHLRLEEVHDALSFYYENQEEIDREIQSRLKDIEKFQNQYKPKLQKWIR